MNFQCQIWKTNGRIKINALLLTQKKPNLNSHWHVELLKYSIILFSYERCFSCFLESLHVFIHCNSQHTGKYIWKQISTNIILWIQLHWESFNTSAYKAISYFHFLSKTLFEQKLWWRIVGNLVNIFIYSRL